MLRFVTPLAALLTFMSLSGAPAHTQRPTAKSAPVNHTQAVRDDVRLRRVSLTLDRGDVREGLKSLFEQTGVSYTIGNDVAGTATINIRNTPFHTALAALIRASSIKLTLRYDGVIFSVDRARPEFPGGTGIPYPPDYTLWRERLNFARAETVAAQLRAMPMFSPAGGTNIVANRADNSLLVNAQIDILREIRERVRLLDGLGERVRIRAHIIVERVVSGKSSPLHVCSVEVRATSGKGTTLTTRLPNGEKLTISLVPTVHEGERVTFDGTARLVRWAKSQPSSELIAQGSWVAVFGEPVLIFRSEIGIRSANRILCYLTPTEVINPVGQRRHFSYVSIGRVMTVMQTAPEADPPIPAEFVTKAADALAIALAETKYEVLRREESEKQAEALGFPKSLTRSDETRVAKYLEADLILKLRVARAEIARTPRGNYAFVRLVSRLELPTEYENSSWEMSLADVLGQRAITAGLDPENALTAALQDAIRKTVRIHAGRKATRGTVLTVGGGPVVVDIGHESGLTTGSRLFLMGYEGPVGRLEVTKVGDGYSLAKVISTSIRPREEQSLVISWTDISVPEPVRKRTHRRK